MGIVGVLHPGAMGGFLASTISAELEGAWVSAGRSAATRARADGLTGFGSLAELAAAAEAIVSICPPGSALDVATQVAATGFSGLYLDANAISPTTMSAVTEVLASARVVDGAVIGGPSTDSGRLYVAGPDAPAAAALFDPARLIVQVLPGPVGSASALKASYALTSKAQSALLFAARAAARASGVEHALLAEWDRTQPGQRASVDRGAATIGGKAWRFVDEMREAADYLDSVGVPSGFSSAAADTFARLADLPRDSDVDPAVTFDAINGTVKPGNRPSVRWRGAVPAGWSQPECPAAAAAAVPGGRAASS